MVQKLTHEVRLQHWKQIVTDCRSSGQSIKDWCEKHEINIKTYYHWQKLVYEATCQTFCTQPEKAPEVIGAPQIPVFAEVTQPLRPKEVIALTIEKNGLFIHIYEGAASQTIASALSALRHLC
ncbi:IS66 family insertion sequence element accessory protein TnpA [Sporomusa acidovorans]|uniref:IS66 family insertion sequence element accessory protein TnpA n=1 Tax=Sporomusa acidovorans TaxID=112900 RepID=UPI000881F277|nr:hypothetical protein [Sporomusa acidovorans]OZC19005.1 hypothetical protein SPACI_30910 [Sporomusa acidovorans DSM 3132]SDD72782.1 hypothetical protein SAMN04488499_1003179 [Sporomusa acidovorans]